MPDNSRLPKTESSARKSEFAAEFAAAVIRWQKRHGRHDLPWQADSSPYKIWLSEVMLQQTRAAAAIPYYEKFLRKWPDADSLARAKIDSVMAMWSGLGYYARARNLHRAAKIFRKDGFPQTAEKWRRIPGVGKSTAAAIAAFAFGERAAILDGNIKRVLARAFAIETPIDSPNGERELQAIAESLLPPRNTIRPYSQGMMDLGAMICIRKKPKCGECPLASFCISRTRDIAEELPNRKARKTKPERRIAMALVRCGELFFLEKRPPSGIWGGLWSLPEDSSAAKLKQKCEKRLRTKMIFCGRGEFAHEFTHFRLRAEVRIWKCVAPAEDASGGWMSRRALPGLALPSPIRKFLLRAESDTI